LSFSNKRNDQGFTNAMLLDAMCEIKASRANLHLSQLTFLREHEKNAFVEGSKILLDTDLNNFVGILKKISNAIKNFDILATSLSVLQLLQLF